MSALLDIRNLTVRYAGREGGLTAVDNVSLRVDAGETVALVGESGCGKSTIAKAVTGLVETSGGEIAIDGASVAGLGVRGFRPIRRKAQMVFQDPRGSLNPRSTVGRIIEEPLIVHGIGTRAERRARVGELLTQVGLPAEAAAKYPDQFSGGQRQRIGIARALALDPKLIIADEPVSALDVSIQGQIVNLLVRLQAERGLAYLFISHDLAVVQHIADRIAVMYLGRIVETGSRSHFWSRPLHPYSRMLIDAVPIADPVAARARTRSFIDGDVPSPAERTVGCSFRTRCAQATDLCARQAPMLRPMGANQMVACHHA